MLHIYIYIYIYIYIHIYIYIYIYDISRLRFNLNVWKFYIYTAVFPVPHFLYFSLFPSFLLFKSQYVFLFSFMFCVLFSVLPSSLFQRPTSFPSYSFIWYSIQPLLEKQFKTDPPLFLCRQYIHYSASDKQHDGGRPVWIKLATGYLHKILIVLFFVLYCVDEDISEMIFLCLRGWKIRSKFLNKMVRSGRVSPT